MHRLHGNYPVLCQGCHRCQGYLSCYLCHIENTSIILLNYYNESNNSTTTLTTLTSMTHLLLVKYYVIAIIAITKIIDERGPMGIIGITLLKALYNSMIILSLEPSS